MSDDTVTIPSTPNPEMQTLVYTAIRAVLQILGTFGITWGETVSGSQWEIVAGAVAVLIGIGWSFVQKFKAARANHAGNVASAVIGTPVNVAPAPT